MRSTFFVLFQSGFFVFIPFSLPIHVLRISPAVGFSLKHWHSYCYLNSACFCSQSARKEVDMWRFRLRIHMTSSDSHFSANEMIFIISKPLCTHICTEVSLTLQLIISEIEVTGFLWILPEVLVRWSRCITFHFPQFFFCNSNNNDKFEMQIPWVLNVNEWS